MIPSLIHYDRKIPKGGYDLIELDDKDLERLQNPITKKDNQLAARLTHSGLLESIESAELPSLLVARDEKGVARKPLDDDLGLFREFAELDPRDAVAIAKFADKSGLLLSGSGLERLDVWKREITRMRSVVDLWEDRGSLADQEQFIRRWNHESSAIAVDGHRIHVSLSQDGSPILPNLRFEPNTLLSALWLQFGQTIFAGRKWRKCEICQSFFIVGEGSQRTDAKYCSSKCRQAAFRRKKQRRGAD